MFPVRKELVGKRFAFIRGDGRTGTRHRGSQAGLHQNWNTLSWVTGTILASNIDALDAQNESVVAKKVKVCINVLQPFLDRRGIRVWENGVKQLWYHRSGKEMAVYFRSVKFAFLFGHIVREFTTKFITMVLYQPSINWSMFP